jgi:hypothetical protein
MKFYVVFFLAGALTVGLVRLYEAYFTKEPKQ